MYRITTEEFLRTVISFQRRQEYEQQMVRRMFLSIQNISLPLKIIDVILNFEKNLKWSE